MEEYETMTDVVGCSCTLLTGKGRANCGTVLADYGYEVEVQLNNGRTRIISRDDILIFD